MVLIFSGYNQRALVAFLRTLDNKLTRYVIIASSSEDQILLSKYKEKVLSTRSNKALNLNDILSCIGEVKRISGAEELLIAPSTEALNRFLLNKRKEFEKMGCVVPLVTTKQYEQISDKEKFTKLCKDNGLDVPRQFQSVRNVNLPVVAKPKVYMNKKGESLSPIIIHTQIEKAEFLRTNNVTDFFYQQFVPGKSFYLLFYFYKDLRFDSFSQENLMQQAEGKSVIAAKTSGIHKLSVSEKYQNLFRGLSFRGLVMVEVKEHNGKYIMIEANPRFWGPSQLFVDARNNLFESFLYDWGQIKSKPRLTNSKKVFRYYWHGGVLSNQKEYKKLTFHNYSIEEYEIEKDSWYSVDVYNRNDTLGIYKKELINEQ